MKTKFVLFALVLSLAATVAFAVEAKPTVKIGVVIPLSGNNARAGEEMRNGIQMAQEELATKGQKNVELFFEDDQMELRQTNLATLRLIQLNKVDALITVWTPAANLVAPIAEREKFIQFNTGWDRSVAENNKWTLTHGGDLIEFARESVEAMKFSSAKKIAVARVQHLGAQKVFDAGKPMLKEAGIEIVFDEPFPPGTRDFRTYVLKIEEKKPDFLWTQLFNPEDEIFFKAVKERGSSWPSTGYYSYSRPDLYPYIEGAIFPYLFPNQQFIEKYQKRFGKAPELVEAGTAYDIVKMISQAANDLYAKLGRAPTREELLTELKRERPLELSVGAGKMNAKGYVESQYVLKQIKNGKIVDYVPAK